MTLKCVRVLKIDGECELIANYQFIYFCLNCLEAPVVAEAIDSDYVAIS